MRSIAGIVLSLAVTSGVATAGNLPEQTAHATGPIIVQRGLPFGSGSVFLAKPVWQPDTAPEMRALGIASAPGRGSIVVHAILADTRSYYAFAGPQIRALVAGDEDGVSRESSAWYIATWDRAIRPFLVKGENAVYLVRNVAEPTAEHPLEAVVFAGANAAGSLGIAVLPHVDGSVAPAASPLDPLTVLSVEPASSRRPL